jgi:hypothetical protein
MSASRFTMARLLSVLAAAAILGGTFVVDPILGLALFLLAGLGMVAYLLREDLTRALAWAVRILARPIGRMGLTLLGLWIVIAPAVLFYDPATYAPSHRGHIARDPRAFYLLFSDDVAYVAASRTWDRTAANLMVPHNTHIVPAWRLLTWGLIASAGPVESLLDVVDRAVMGRQNPPPPTGSLQRVPEVLAVAAYWVLVASMLLTGRFVARETGRTAMGLAASALVGITSLMLTPATWYSGGQPLWAGLAILATLWYAQSYRRNGRWPNLVLAALATALAGSFWSAGHLAGPVASVYLWFDGRRRCRLVAAVPLIATAVAVVLLLSLAARPMDSKVSFHGRTVQEAMNPIQGAITTVQAIPENLIFANLGLDAMTTPIQGVVLTLGLLLLWTSRRRRRPEDDDGQAAVATASAPSRSIRGGPAARRVSWPTFAFNPMECAGAALVLGCYLLEWTFRGYFQYHNLRTLNPYAIVPWYDVLPQVGAALFAVGWWSGPFRPAATVGRASYGRPISPTRSAALGLALLALGLLILNRPRVDALIRALSPPLTASERESFKIERLLTMRANLLLAERVKWQRGYLRRLDQVEPVARRLGIGQDGIRAAFGHIYIPASTGRLLLAQRELYDVAAILDLPPRGRTVDPAVIRAALGPYLHAEPEPRPDWLAPGEKWPAE